MNALLEIIVDGIEIAYVYYITYGFERRKNKTQIFVGYIFLFIFNIIINFAWEFQFEWLKVIICLTMTFVFIKIFYLISLLKRIILIVIYFMSITVAEIVVIGYLMLMNNLYITNELLSNEIMQMVAVICSKTITWIILYVN